MKVQKKINIILNGNELPMPVRVVATDTAIQLVLRYVDLEIPSDAKATLFVMKPSKNFVYQTDDITINGNVVTINVKNQAIIEKGRAYFTVTLTSGEDSISTFENYFDVDRNYSSLEAEESKTIIGDLISEEMIKDYINAYLTENPAITDEQLGNAISAYFAKNPITGGSVSANQIAQAVEDYLTEHPVSGGATAEQAEQIEKNRQDISLLSETMNDLVENGVTGYTPVKGTDYWTEADKAEIKSYVDEAILGGEW